MIEDPTIASLRITYTDEEATGGAELRDVFACHAMEGLIVAMGPSANNAKQVSPAREIAEAAYRIADAMLEARS